MARRRGSNRRRRRGGFGVLYKLLTTLVICVVIVVALTLFFRVDTIVITGTERYTAQQVEDASGVEHGDNLILLNKHELVQHVQEALPYVQDMRVNRKLPDTLLVEVEECGTPLALIQDGSAWLVSPRGKIVEQKDAAAAADYALIDGCQLLSPAVGGNIVLSTEYPFQQQSLLDLIAALEEEAVLDQVGAIHLDDISVLTMDYAGRFQVELPYGADYHYKLRYLKLAVESLETNMTGTIQMLQDNGEVHFIED